MKKYFVIIPILFMIYIFTLSDETNSFDEQELIGIKNTEDVSNEKEISNNLVQVSYNGENLSMTIDEYIKGVLACEMPASFNLEALKAGAVAARTFYMYKIQYIPSYVATNNDQCFIDENQMKSKWSNSYDKYYSIVSEAVNDTTGEMIYYDGKVIEAFYFSMSNGYTENIENVFSESRPYLVSVESSWEKSLNNYEKTLEMSKSDFLNKLGLEKSNSINISNIDKSSSGRINNITVNGVNFKGTDFRKKLSIRSTDFDIEINDKVTITTRGYGHGVGLSQYGANEMAKLGYNYKDILKYYYSGVEISSL